MLQEPWPHFLDLMSSDARRAGEEFCAAALKYMNTGTPVFLRPFPPEERAEIIHEICLHFIKDDLRVLRQYRSMERGFGAWFYVIAYNFVRDQLRRRNRQPQFFDTRRSTSGGQAIVAEDVVTPVRPNQEVLARLTTVRDLIKTMDQYCQLLLRFGAQEFKPKEIARAMRWPQTKAKKISDDLSYCREKLHKILSDNNVEIGLLS